MSNIINELFANNSMLYIFGFSVVFLMFLLGRVLFRYNSKNKEDVSLRINDVYKAFGPLLTPIDAKLDSDLAKRFTDDLKKIEEVINHRVNIGNVFHDTMPFPFAIINSDEELVVSNDLFHCTCNLSPDVKSWGGISSAIYSLDSKNPVKIQDGGNYSVYVMGPDGRKNYFKMTVSLVKTTGNSSHIIYMYPCLNKEEIIKDEREELYGQLNKFVASMKLPEFSVQEKSDKNRDDLVSNGGQTIINSLIEVHDFFLAKEDKLEDNIIELEKNIESNISANSNTVQKLAFSMDVINTIKEDILPKIREESILSSVLAYQWNEAFQVFMKDKKEIMRDCNELILKSESTFRLLGQDIDIVRLKNNYYDHEEKAKAELDSVENLQRLGVDREVTLTEMIKSCFDKIEDIEYLEKENSSTYISSTFQGPTL